MWQLNFWYLYLSIFAWLSDAYDWGVDIDVMYVVVGFFFFFFFLEQYVLSASAFSGGVVARENRVKTKF